MSAAVKLPPKTGGGLAAGLSPHAPSILLPLRFMVTGLLALAGVFVALVARPELLATYHYNQYVVAVTHLMVLGWMSTLVMGAMYQLVPVALETKLYSERLARWQFAFHTVGFAGMVWMFWTWDLKQVGHFGSVLTVGVGLFVYNIARTLCRVPRWNVIAAAVASALGWLSLAVLAGLTLAAGKCTYESGSTLGPGSPFGPLVNGLKSLAGFTAHFDPISAMHAHAHLGGVGVFLILIVGISFKLVPMFTLSEMQSPWRARLSLLLLNVGLLGSFFAVLLRSWLKPVAAAFLLVGLGLYACELYAILRARKRRTMDWGVRYFLTALSLLAPVGALAAALSWPRLPLNLFTGQLENLYGFLAFVGVVSFAIIGMLYKIIPFLVWYRAYSAQIGLRKVPSLAELYSARVQQMGYWTYLGGLVTASIGIVLSHSALVRSGGALLLVSFLVLAVNLGRILRHLFQPEFETTPEKPALAPKRAHTTTQPALTR